MKARVTAGLTALAVCALGAFGVATAASGSKTPASATASGGSRLDDGKDLLPQAQISEQQAIAAARTAASGDLNEVDLEQYQGRLVFNVDVGAKDVKVDASNGDVVAATADD
jgi:uncharacterized membrane protein YkoI